MATAQKMSRNRQRKAAYSALANKGSRNQDTIEVMTCPKCGGARGSACSRCGGVSTVPVSGIVKQDDAERVKAPKRETNARQTARRLRAESREHRAPWDQLVALDDRLGAGVGAVKERARLTKAMRSAA